jgi:colicin import membrane protein
MPKEALAEPKIEPFYDHNGRALYTQEEIDQYHRDYAAAVAYGEQCIREREEKAARERAEAEAQERLDAEAARVAREEARFEKAVRALVEPPKPPEEDPREIAFRARVEAEAKRRLAVKSEAQRQDALLLATEDEPDAVK